MKNNHALYAEILEKELVPAMGCTEPIAIAFAGAKVRETLGKMPEKILVRCSGNIIKNVKGVVVPSTENMRGIEVSAILGVLSNNATEKLEVLKNISQDCISKMKELKDMGYCKVELAENVENLYVDILAVHGSESAEVILTETHTHIEKILKNNKCLYDDVLENGKAEDEKEDMSLRDIYDFSKFGDIEKLKPLLDLQIRHNYQISVEGLTHSYGANVGKTLLGQNRDNSIELIAKAYASAGSDARMAGCEMPVVINSGSGNQGITVTVPVLMYAKHLNSTQEELYRALVLSNLVAIYIKKGIGKLSAYCGVVGASCGAGAGISFLYHDSYDTISKVITNTLGNVSGIICDGAKASCAAKIASSLDAMLLARKMAIHGNSFQPNEGIIKEDVEDTIKNVWRLGKDGMKETDIEILNMMISV